MTGLFTKRKSCEKSQRPLPLPSSHCHVKPFLLALKKHVNGRMFIKDIKRQEIFLVLCFIWLCFTSTFSVVVMGMFGYGDVWRRTCQNTIVLRHYFHHFFTFSHFSRFYHQSTVIVDGSCRYDNDLCII
jgi:hypothetical protein